ncbi:fused MFS/spermidine synthase [Sphingomonas donggukensis]|uniref:Fused MFS/spermidine synthase n=1 Tax=Sphingomonas donggukensis TaxID=2949093 RepID=A0ABY4TWD9_9SPHN|nr:fused MFS/spermidine synthase [Sphingomonas donggukensis]URW76672.1 fused MFS/spermidine synthase [Sphingomonas donggukensis]
MTAAAIGVAPVRSRRALFVATILTGSFLLFLVQPMVARMALPKLGGAPAVWNSAMLVYQALLLGGYAYAHWLATLSQRRAATIHLGVLALAALWLPLGLFASGMPAGAEPALWVPWLLGASIGPLFFAVSAQAPLMQRWYALAEPGRDPYALYAASNVGSFGGLIAYPLLVEPGLALKMQSLVWSGGYVLLIALVALCAWRLPRGDDAIAAAATVSPPPPRRRVAHWIVLAAVPSGLMLATSTFLTTDIVAVPLLWVLPLGLYLLSFTVAFAADSRVAKLVTTFAPVMILLFGGAVIAGRQDTPYLNALMALLLLFAVAVALHARMYALRPEPDRLTGFYLAMAIGGALGGVFAGLLAPVIFDWTYEYPLLILAAGALAPQLFLLPFVGRFWRVEGWPRSIRIAAVVALTGALILVGLRNPGGWLGHTPENFAFLALAVLGVLTVGARISYVVVLAGALFLFGGYRALEVTMQGDQRTRSYFGVYTIRDYPDVRTLAHGTTLHGVELTGSPLRERVPTSYYTPGSGVGRAMMAVPALYGPNARIGVVGLGTGTLACYAQPGQDWRFFEIDPAVVRIARDPAKFRFLSRCAPDATIVVGDARRQLLEQPTSGLDLLALDAFSSDAVPMHLMTREAFATYARALQPRGLLLVHISNRFLDLEPVVGAAGAGGGWYGAQITFEPGIDDGTSASTSDWIALSRDSAVLGALVAQGGAWRPLRLRKGFVGWTDDYATILPLLRGWR